MRDGSRRRREKVVFNVRVDETSMRVMIDTPKEEKTRDGDCST